MKKSYLLLMMLFVQLIMGGKAFAADPPQAEYEAALAAIPSGAYYITTEVDGVKYYVTASGSLEERYEGIEASEGLFTINQKTGGALYSVGWHIEGANGHFSNTTLSNDKALLNPGTGVFRLDTGNNRDDWESQVFFMNEEGKIAIRSCNTAYGESSWADAGRAFWTYQVDEVGEIVWGDFGPMPAYSYEPAYIWTLEQPEGKERVYMVLNNLYTKYEEYIWEDVNEPTILNFGTGFGQLTDLETWVKFWNLIQEVSAICDNFVDPDYDYYMDPDAPTLEDAEKYAADADSLYQVILDSEVPYTMENGYYRIFTAERYKSTFDESGYVDKAIAASFDKVNHENKGIYGTVRRDLANYVWKLTKSESGDSIMIQNVGMGTYISKSATSEFVMMTEDKNDAAHLVFDYAGPINVAYASDGGEIVEDERDIFAIRLASEPRGGSYIHQQNHGTPNEEDWSYFGYSQTDTGIDQDLKFWIRTYNRTNADGSQPSDNWTSEWYLEPVSEEEVKELEEAFGPIKNHELLVQMNQQLRDKVLKAMDKAKDLTLIKKVDQLSSPHSDPDEGKNLGALIDNVSSTFWHSTWHGYAEGVTGMMYYGEDYGEAGRECHYLQISGMQEMVGECELYWREREGADNDRPTKIVLMGAESANTPNDEWVEMAVVDIPNSDKGAENHIPLNIETAYPFVRILVIEVNSSFRSFWHASEIQFKLKTPGPTSQFVVLGEVATTLESTYLANLEIADADITIEDYNALLEAYNAFMEYLVDPTELRTALSNYSKATEGVVEGQNPGQWADVTVPNQYNELYAEVDAYNKAGRYKAAQIHKYAVMLKAMQKSVMEKANVVETDKWYRIMFPTEEMFDAYNNFTKDGGDNCNELAPEDQKTMWGTFVSTAKLESEEETYIDDETGEEKTRTNSWLEAIGGEDLRESDRLFFMNDDDIEDKDASMFRFVEKEAEGVDYAPLFQDAKDNMAMALDMSTTYARVDTLITKASQLSSNASDSSEGQHIEYLIDGKSDTFWHSDWHKNVIAPPYLQVAFDEPVSGLVQVEITRRNNDFGHIVRMFIVGSNDGETWTNIGYLEAPYGGTPGETIACLPVNLEGSYKYLRFINTCRWLNGGGNSAEMDPFAEPKSADEYDVTWTYFHAAEFQLYSVVPEKELSASAQALQEAYTTANKILIKDVTAEDLAATAGAYRAFRSEFNAEEGKDVLPYGIDKVAPVYAIQNKATGLFVNANNGNGGNTNDVNLRTIPTFFDYKALGYERSLLHGTQINGTTPNNLHAGESNRRLCTWTTTEAKSNSGLVIVEADEEYAAPESFTFFKDIKPGRIADWCHSVTITPVEANEEAGAYMVVGQFTEGEDEDAETFIALQKMAVIEAGKPALYILGDTTSYDAEDEYVEPMKFTISGAEKPVVESTGVNGLFGTLVPVTLDKYEIFFNGNHAECKEGQGLTACSAYLDLEVCPQTNPGGLYDFVIVLGQAASDVVDGVKDVSSALENISKPGNVYSMDGKLLRTNATLNSLKTMGKGMYILNGVKVIVK